MLKKTIFGLCFASLAALVPGISSFADPQNFNCTGGFIKKDCRNPADKPNLEGTPKSIKLKPIPLVRKLTLPGQELLTEQHCQAAFEISYMQRNDLIRVDTTINNEDCGPSSGEYALRIRTYKQSEDGSSEPVTRTVNERWQRNSAEPVLVSKDYPMDGGSHVGWVRIKADIASSCLCAAEGDAEGP